MDSGPDVGDVDQTKILKMNNINCLLAEGPSRWPVRGWKEYHHLRGNTVALLLFYHIYVSLFPLKGKLVTEGRREK